MASNRFGDLFTVTTWGESHGRAMGVVIDGCPSGVDISESEINDVLSKRAPGRSPLTSPRKEPDLAEIYSGVFEGKTTGAPLSILIQNQDADSSKYESIKDILRPGHANFTYQQKYGCFDYRGGGRASARETVCRVAAGAVAQKILLGLGIEVKAYLKQVGHISADAMNHDALLKSSIFCPDCEAEKKMIQLIEQTQAAGDSLGGIVEFYIQAVPAGLGDPVYEKLEANLAKAMLSIPACKGFEIGDGFKAASMKGSEHNDCFVDLSTMDSNHAGGVLAGISTGMPVIGRAAFKPTSSIKKPQKTMDKNGNKIDFMLPEGSRHDPCVAIRAVPVVEAMCALVLVDAYLKNLIFSR